MKILIFISLILIFNGVIMAQEKLEKAASCYVIVFAEPFEKKEFDKIYLPHFQLLDICPKRDPKLAYQEAKIKLKREGKEFETSFDVVKIFKNKAEAKKFADKFGVTDESMLLNEIPKCNLIRVIDMPLRKRNDKPTTPTIALLDVCLPPEANNIQHPVITFEENGKKVSRIFEVIKTFANKEEAEKYAKENGIVDIDFSDN